MNKNSFGKELLNSYAGYLNNYKTPDHINPIDISKGHGKTSRVELNNKNYLSKNNPSLSYNKNIISDDRRKNAPRNTDYIYDRNNNNKKLNRNTFLKYNDDINNSKSINNKQYYTYKQYNKNRNVKNRPLYNFKNNNLKSFKNPNENSSKKIPSEKYINSVCKIQSMWRGAYVRELMTYYWCLSKFKDLLDLVLMNHAKKNFFNYIRLIQNRKEKLAKLRCKACGLKFETNIRPADAYIDIYYRWIDEIEAKEKKKNSDEESQEKDSEEEKEYDDKDIEEKEEAEDESEKSNKEENSDNENENDDEDNDKEDKYDDSEKDKDDE
jgi:transcription elongation factor Elf1